MKTLEELQQELAPILEEIEVFRLDKIAAIQRNQNWYIIPMILTSLALISFLFQYLIISAICGLLLVPSITLIYLNKIQPYEKAFLAAYKQKVIGSLAAHISPNIYYNANARISDDSFNHSNFFHSEMYFGISGSDCFKGEVENNCHFEFSTISLLDAISQDEIYLEGFLFALKTPQHNTSDFIAILSQKLAAQLRPKSVSRIRFSSHIGFDNEFRVYAKNEEEATTVLSSEVINMIYNLQQEWNAPLNISMYEDMIYIAVETPSDYFTANHKNAILTDDSLDDLYENLILCFSTVERFSDLTNIPKKYNNRNWANTAYKHFNNNDEMPQL